MKIKRTLQLCWLICASWCAWGQEKTTLTFYHGLDTYPVEVLPNTRPPLVHLDPILKALNIQQGTMDQGFLRLEINRRPLILDKNRQQAQYKQKSVPFPLRESSGKLYVRVDALVRVFSELLGRKMIYEPTSKTLHVPKSEDLTITLRTRKVPDGYRLILIYSQPIKAPKVDQAGRNLILKLQEESIFWDRSGFQTNPAVTGMEIFENLPDQSTEILFKIGKTADKYVVEPYSPQNPRSVIKITGTFDESAAGNASGPNSAVPTSGLDLIVIDPGHGGIDMGAVGPTGLREKDVTLELGNQLKSLLENKYQYRVAMTRDDDTFLSLKARTGLANNLNASLLISIHVNAIKFPNARGSETYYLSIDESSSFDASHYEEFRDRNTPNSVDPEEEESDELTLMLWDMAQTKHTEDSFRIARYIQSELNNLAGIRSRGVKQAPLKVLKGATMPAILIEVAFISNKFEEKKLKDRLFKEKIVESIAKAIRHYDEDVRKRDLGRNGSDTKEGL